VLGGIVSVTYNIDVNKRTVRTKCIGPVTINEVIDHFRALQQDPDCPELLDVFLDLSELDSLPETSDISAVVNVVKRLRDQVRFGTCAILARRDAVFGMMRIFEVMAEECFRVTRTFRDADQAETWLVLQQSLADQQQAQAR
jgi:hypothetical protein